MEGNFMNNHKKYSIDWSKLNNDDSIQENKTKLEINIEYDLLRAAESRWNVNCRSFIEQIISRELKKELELMKKDIDYIVEFEDTVIEKFKKISEEIYSFQFGCITIIYTFNNLRYSPQLIIEITRSAVRPEVHIRFKGKETSRIFREYLSVAIDNLLKYGIKKHFGSVVDLNIPINGEDINKDVSEIYDIVMQFVQILNQELINAYRIR